MKKAIVKKIGEQAIDKNDRMIIFFNDEATIELKKVSVIQEFSENSDTVELKKGGIISIDNNDYEITQVGSLATKQLNTIGHITMIFDEVPVANEVLSSAVYLSPVSMPSLVEGSVISYY